MIESFFIVVSRLLLVFIGFKLYRILSKPTVLEEPVLVRDGKLVRLVPRIQTPRTQKGFVSFINPVGKLALKARHKKLGGNYKVPWGW